MHRSRLWHFCMDRPCVATAATSGRILATILFTDIVASTERARQLGDNTWRELLKAHDVTVRREIMRYRGNEVKSTGDGFWPYLTVQHGQSGVRSRSQKRWDGLVFKSAQGCIRRSRADQNGCARDCCSPCTHHGYGNCRRSCRFKDGKGPCRWLGIELDDAGEHVMKGL